MSISFHDLGCEEYRVRVAADDAGLDAILAAPACTAFLAALKDAREARVSFSVAYAALIESERVASEDREARLRSTPEGAAFQSAQDVVDEGSAACEAAREALTAARAQEAINRLLGREWVALVDRALVSKAQADLDAATGAMPELYEVSRRASRALLEACADARRANDLAYSKMVERRRLLRQAHERLRVAAQPLEHIVVLEIRNPLWRLLFQANEALTLAHAGARQADDELRKAAEPLRPIVSLHANHWSSRSSLGSV